MKKELTEHEQTIRRLDVISIFLLAQKGLSQREIGKILGISGHTIGKIYGKKYSKILPQKKPSGKK